ncbi:MAG: hypothetical protein U0570_16250 [Phycisphaerales bacterium]
MQGLKRAAEIVLLSVFAAVAYGIVHDQITARICIEYFTVAHPKIIESKSPTLLGLAWGVVATWWAGLGVGIVLALSSRLGRWPKLTWRDNVRPVALLLCAMTLYACFWGWLFPQIAIPLTQDSFWGGRIPASKYHAFLTCSGAHNASYESGFFGGLSISAWAIWRRYRAAASTRDRQQAEPNGSSINGDQRT